MKQNKYLILILVAIVAFSSCEKQLELQPTDTFSSNNAYLSVADIQLGANACYQRYGGAYLNTIYTSALLSDEAKLGLDNAGQGALTYRYQFNSDNTVGGDVVAAYGAYYTVIDQVNRVLPYISTVTGTPAEEGRRDILKGQMLALRGISHFGLLQAYSKNYSASDANGIPVMTVSDPLGKPKRSTMGETMRQIELDLADAKALLPAETVTSFRDTVMNRVNVAAYQARVALYKGDFAAAVTYSTEVINSAVKPLVNGANFAGIWTDANANETLFRIRYATSTAMGELWTTTGGQYYIAPSDKLLASYTTTDSRRNVFIGSNSGNLFVNKYFASSRGGRVLDQKACRISEMYLIRAEAYARIATPNIAAGTADLNLLRKNRITSYTDVTLTTAAELLAAVLVERYKELPFEGFRFWDLRRNNLPVQRNASDASALWQTLDAGSYRFVLPIPRSEILLNPNMVQNDGY